MNREGFWAFENKSELPIPHREVVKWENRKEFVERLDKIERSKAKKRHHKGWANCATCGKENGSIEYEYKGWCWPEGLRHYIVEHKLRVSLAFEEFILGREIR